MCGGVSEGVREGTSKYGPGVGVRVSEGEREGSMYTLHLSPSSQPGERRGEGVSTSPVVESVQCVSPGRSVLSATTQEYDKMRLKACCVGPSCLPKRSALVNASSASKVHS